jgi:amino acid transporter
MYAGAPLALGTFRRRLPEADRPYRVPGGALLAPLAFVVANLLILWSGWTTDYKLGIAILIGYAILAANRLFKLNPTTPLLDLRAAQWLPVYLVGLGAVVYLSDFGPLKHPWFPLGGTWSSSRSSASRSTSGPCASPWRPRRSSG